MAHEKCDYIAREIEGYDKAPRVLAARWHWLANLLVLEITEGAGADLASVDEHGGVGQLSGNSG